jgi:hypothetical protein
MLLTFCYCRVPRPLQLTRQAIRVFRCSVVCEVAIRVLQFANTARYTRVCDRLEM